MDYSDFIKTKYNYIIDNRQVDVYNLIKSTNIVNPAVQHLFKKLIKLGNRGHKSKEQDIKDIQVSAKRAIELENEHINITINDIIDNCQIEDDTIKQMIIAAINNDLETLYQLSLTLKE